MAATVKIRSHHGAGDDGGTDCDGTTLRFKTADNDTQNTSNQMVRPGGATPNYSYIKQLQMRVTVAPVTSITNLKFYMSGTAPTGTAVLAKSNAAYVDATAQASTALTGTTSAYTYTATVPLSLAGSFASSAAVPANFGDFVELQFNVISTASLGTAISTGSAVFRWDEQ